MDNTQPLAFILTAISQVGFPIVVAGYLLIRFEKKLTALGSNYDLFVQQAGAGKQSRLAKRAHRRILFCNQTVCKE